MYLGMNVGWVATYTGSYHFANVMYTASRWFRATGSGSFTDDQGVLTATYRALTGAANLEPRTYVPAGTAKASPQHP